MERMQKEKSAQARHDKKKKESQVQVLWPLEENNLFFQTVKSSTGNQFLLDTNKKFKKLLN